MMYCKWFAVLILHVSRDFTCVLLHTDPGMMPLKLHTVIQRRKRSVEPINIIMMLLLLGVCQGLNGLSMKKTIKFATMHGKIVELVVFLCFVSGL